MTPDNRCLRIGGAGGKLFSLEPCGWREALEWNVENGKPGAPLTLRPADPEAADSTVSLYLAPAPASRKRGGSWFRLCADRWCARCVSRGKGARASAWIQPCALGAASFSLGALGGEILNPYPPTLETNRQLAALLRAVKSHAVRSLVAADARLGATLSNVSAAMGSPIELSEGSPPRLVQTLSRVGLKAAPAAKRLGASVGAKGAEALGAAGRAASRGAMAAVRSAATAATPVVRGATGAGRGAAREAVGAARGASRAAAEAVGALAAAGRAAASTSKAWEETASRLASEIRAKQQSETASRLASEIRAKQQSAEATHAEATQQG